MPSSEWRRGKVELRKLRGPHRDEEANTQPNVSCCRTRGAFTWDVGMIMKPNKAMGRPGHVSRNRDDMEGSLFVVHPTVQASVIRLWNHLEHSIPHHENNSRRVPLLHLRFLKVSYQVIQFKSTQLCRSSSWNHSCRAY